LFLQSVFDLSSQPQAGMTVTDDPEEENKQRTFKGILNKLTPDNFERLSQQLLDVGITEAKTLIGLIAQVGCICNLRCMSVCLCCCGGGGQYQTEAVGLVAQTQAMP
jgi:hypothetical protein